VVVICNSSHLDSNFGLVAFFKNNLGLFEQVLGTCQHLLLMGCSLLIQHWKIEKKTSGSNSYPTI
jgi:hypothetical protein